MTCLAFSVASIERRRAGSSAYFRHLWDVGRIERHPCVKYVDNDLSGMAIAFREVRPKSNGARWC
jgi:hypothetical protein